MPPHFTYDEKKLTRRGRNHKKMPDIQGCMMTRIHTMIGFNKGKLINGHNLSIMGKIHHSKECGHYDFHGINIVTPKEQIKI